MCLFHVRKFDVDGGRPDVVTCQVQKVRYISRDMVDNVFLVLVQDSYLGPLNVTVSCCAELGEWSENMLHLINHFESQY